MPYLRPVRAACFTLALFVLMACNTSDTPDEPADEESFDGPLVMDTNFLTQELWDDGLAEVAFYEVERGHTPYEDDEEQSFTVGTYLVKHDYAVDEQTKAVDDMTGEPAFKYALFYEFESGSYDYKRNYMVNARQDDLRPFKQSFTSFDWCSNIYREFAIDAEGTVSTMMRSDDYGNADYTFDYQQDTFTPAQLPTAVRGMDFEAATDQTFYVMLEDGQLVQGQAALIRDDDTLDIAGEERRAERITLTFVDDVPSMISESDVSQETYWRGVEDDRLLLRVRGSDHEMQLVEHLRSAYWEDDLWEEVERVDTRP